tara:strand:+ start:4241 stop:5290 length:1050 start_codon:yes stop_codon:yes gene_type:complete
MAYSATQLAETQRTAFEKDNPVLLGENALELVPTSTQGWRSWDSSSFGGDNNFGAYTVSGVNYDATDSNFPAKRMSDRFTHRVSRALKPTGISTAYNDRWSFIFKFTSGFTFDSVAILGHNLGTLSKTFGTSASGNAFTIKLGVSDDGNTWTTIATFTDPQTDKPLVSFNLANGSGSPSTFATFSGVVYFGISIVCASAQMGQTAATLPEIGELVVGQRLQLLHQARVPYSDRATFNVSEREPGVTGVSAVDISNAGGRNIRGIYQLTGDEDALVSLYENTLIQGLLPFLFVPRGSKANFPTSYLGSEPGEAFWVMMKNSLSVIPDASYLDMSVELNLVEQAPFNSGIS